MARSLIRFHLRVMMGQGKFGTWYENLNPGDIVDIALTPVGPDGNASDGSDGSANWFTC